MTRSRREQLQALFERGLRAVHAGTAVSREVRRETSGQLVIAGRPLPDDARLFVVALGKAAASMAQALEAVASDRIHGGLIVTKDGHAGAQGTRLPTRECGHPVPDGRSEAAGREILALVARLRPDDALLLLLSGGASALTTCPAPGLLLEDLAGTTSALLACAADIEQVNVVRKHLSALSGGRLAAAAACRRIDVLAVSDVAGDRQDVIGSGPCEPDPSSFADALAVIERHGLRGRVPARVLAHLEAGVEGEREETPGPDDPRLAGVRSVVIASNAELRVALAEAARAEDLLPIDLGLVLAGEARIAGRRLAALACSLRVARPVLLIAGGETVVNVSGRGRGGRNQELALAATIELASTRASQLAAARVVLLAAGSDGSDGPTDAAGAWADEDVMQRAEAAGLDARAALRDNDSHGFFRLADGLLRTGPTGTNVMDLVLVLVEAAAEPV